jgi:hypothetical protein
LVRSLTQDFHNIQECPHNNWAWQRLEE